MEKKIVSTFNVDNIDNVQLSEKTKTLLKCKAMLQDVQYTLYNLYANPEQSDIGDRIAREMIANYDKADVSIHEEIDKLIMDSIIDNLNGTEFKQI